MSILIVSRVGNGKSRCRDCCELFDRIVTKCPSKVCKKWKEKRLI